MECIPAANSESSRVRLSSNPLETIPQGYSRLFNSRFSAGKRDHHLMRVHVRRDFVYHFQEIFDRHVRMGGRDMAVATAMEAGGVTTERALPKERTQFMYLGSVLPDASE